MATTSLTIHVCKALWDREGFGLKICHPLLVIFFYIHKLDRLPLEQAEEEYHRPLHFQYYSVTFPVFHLLLQLWWRTGNEATYYNIHLKNIT